MKYHIYDSSTGVFNGHTIQGDADLVTANTPAGFGVMSGVSDWRAMKVDTANGSLVDYVPPAPADSVLETWAWDTGTKRWLSTPTELAVANSVRAERARRLVACDWVTARATDRGEAVPTAWVTYRNALRDVPDQSGFPYTIDWPVAPS